MGRKPITKKKKKDMRNVLILLTALALGVVAYLYIFTDYLSPVSGQPPADSNLSTFTLRSGVDGEDVSDFIEISLWIPDDDETPSEWTIEEIYTQSSYQEEKSSTDADDVSYDLSGIQYAWIEIDPDEESVFQRTMIPIFGGVNLDYTININHASSDVNFNVHVESTMAAITVGDLQLGDNYTVVMDVPHYTTTNKHVGTNWDIEQSEFDDYTQKQVEFVADEKNYRNQAPVYIMTDDDEKEYDKDLEQTTDCFALEWDFNGTISTTDGETTQINATIDSANPIEVAISGDKIYLIFYETIDFESGPYSFGVELVCGTNIHLDNVKTGRLPVPRDDDSLGVFVVYSAIGA